MNTYKKSLQNGFFFKLNFNIKVLNILKRFSFRSENKKR